MIVYEIAEKLCFHANYRGTRYLGRGWSAPEKNHCWSDGYEAEILLNFRELSDNDLLLRVNCCAFLAGNTFDHLDVDVRVNGIFICSWKVGNKLWHETVINRKLIETNLAKITFYIFQPTSPAQYRISNDIRLLGIDIDSLVIFERFVTEPSRNKLIGHGHDLVGDVYKSLNGFHRAIKNDSYQMFTRILESGAYDYLARMRLLPENYFYKIESERYKYLCSSLTGYFIYPANYPLLMLVDAAKVWISINRYLLKLFKDDAYGLSDGHYGNFIQFYNATPMWCDLGSIVNNSSSLSFGLAEFIKCFVIPLTMFGLENPKNVNVRQLMAHTPKGITSEKAISLFGRDFSSLCVSENRHYDNREEALNDLERIINDCDFSHHKGFWSDYRKVDALNSAWAGDLLQKNEDTRYKAVIDLVRRSEATTFIDIGCNDGIFSLMCLHEGLKGVAMDLDEYAINKLYSFVRQNSEIELSIAYGGFLDVAYMADLVLALALTHHLVISQQLTFSDVAKKLANVAARSVITEFMPDGLGGTPQHPAPYPNPLPAGYCLENFVSELRNYFETVEIISYQRRKDMPWYSSRVLIYCEKSTDHFNL